MPEINETSLQALRALRSTDPLLSSTFPTSKEETNTTSPGYSQHVQFDNDGNITTLNLGGRRLRKLPNIPEVFASLKQLTTLNLGSSDLAPPLLVNILKSVPSLLHFHLSGNGLRDNGIQLLSPCIAQLQTLDLRYNDITSIGLGHLGEALESKNTLHILHLEGNMVKDDGISTLTSSLLSSPYNYIKELYLGSNQIEAGGAQSLSKLISANKSLQKLHLEGNNIGPNGAEALATVLEEMEREERVLEKLYVDNNNMGKEVAQRLAKALNSDSTIVESMF